MTIDITFEKRADEANSRANAIAAEFAKYKAEHP